VIIKVTDRLFFKTERHTELKGINSLTNQRYRAHRVNYFPLAQVVTSLAVMQFENTTNRSWCRAMQSP